MKISPTWLTGQEETSTKPLLFGIPAGFGSEAAFDSNVATFARTWVKIGPRCGPSPDAENPNSVPLVLLARGG
jgi:hypothetical protein